MTRKISRDAARALTNGKSFNKGNTIVTKELQHINHKVGYDVAHTLTYYTSTLAYVHCGMLYIGVPMSYDTKSTWDRIDAILQMWGKQEFRYLLERESGKFFNLGAMN